MAGKHSIGSRIALIALFLFGLPFAAGGLALDVGLLKLTYDDLRMTRWREVPCTILATDLELIGHGDSSSYRLTARYRYEFDGKEHIGQEVTNDDSDDSNGSFKKRLHAELEQARTSQKPFRCFVNPNAPNESILYRGARWGFVALETLAAVLFSGVGFALLSVAVVNWFRGPASAAADPSTAPKPWKKRADWARGEIRHSDRTASTVLIWSGLAVLLVSCRSLLASSTELLFTNDMLAILGLLPSAIGLLIVMYGRRRRARWRRYGDSVFQMAAVPGVIGGSFAGVVRVDRRVESPEGLKVRLRCVESSQTSSSDNISSSDVHIMWEDERTIIHELRSAGSEGIAIPVYFAIPYEAPESDDDSRSTKTSWTLSVRAISSEADYAAEFSVPVFRTSESRPNFKPDESLIADYEAPVDSQAPIRQAGLRIEPLENGSLFVFPAWRNPGFVIFVLLFQSAFVAGVSALCYFKWPAAWPVAAFFGAGMLYSIVDLFGYTSEIEATQAGLAVRGGIFNLGGRRDIPTAEIEKVVAEGIGSSKNPMGFDLFAVLTGGKKVRLAKRVWPRSAADLVVQQIEEILGKKPAKSSDS